MEYKYKVVLHGNTQVNYNYVKKVLKYNTWVNVLSYIKSKSKSPLLSIPLFVLHRQGDRNSVSHHPRDTLYITTSLIYFPF